MIKGVHKSVVRVRLSKNRYFESAYFVLRRTAPSVSPKSTDMLGEANRILSEHDLLEKKKTPAFPRGQRIRYFVGGSLCGGLIVSLIGFLLYLL